MNIIYRVAAESDLDSIVRFSNEQNHDESRPDFILSRIKDGVFVVALDENGNIIAYRYGMRFCGDIFGGENFLVDHRHRGKGIGTNLSKYMFKILKEKGYKLALTGNSDYYPPVKGAIKNGKWIRPTNFYKRLGYKLVAETEQTRLFIIDLDNV